MPTTLKNRSSLYALPFVGVIIVGMFVAMVFAVVLILKPYSFDVAKEIRKTSNSLQISSQVKDFLGRDLGAFSDQARYVVPIEDVPSRVQRAFVAAEDDGFWRHRGVSPKGMLRAAIANVRRDRFAQGGSTITQQLIRQLLLPREKTIFRKFREIVLAIVLERQMSKKEILGLWLNSVYLGNNAWGVEAASRHYFNKHVKQLTIAEASLLAGLPQAPSAYAPHLRPKLARKRQMYVLDRMRSLGWITEGAYVLAVKNKPRVEKRRDLIVDQAPWVTEMARVELWRRLEQKNLPGSGLVINTTIDKNWQLDLQSQIQTAFHGLDRDGLQLSVLVMDTKSAAIRAIIGGSDFTRSQFNRAVDLDRPLGASIYPLLFVWGMEKGLLNVDGYSSIAEAAVRSRFAEAEQLAPEIGYGLVREKLLDVGLKIDESMAIDELTGSPLSLARTYLGIGGSSHEGSAFNGLISKVISDEKLLYQQLAEPLVSTTPENFSWVVRQWMALGSHADSKVLAGQPLLKTIKGWNAWWVIPRTDVIITAWLGAELDEPRNPESLKENSNTMDQVLASWLSRNLKPSALGQAPEGISYHMSPGGRSGKTFMRLPIVVPSAAVF